MRVNTSSKRSVWTVDFQHNTSAMLDSTTYYFGKFPAITHTTTSTVRKFTVKYDSYLTGASIESIVAGTIGTNESTSFYVRVNDTTDILLTSNFTYTATHQNQGPSITPTFIAAGSDIQIKIVTPAYATNPTNVSHAVELFFELA